MADAGASFEELVRRIVREELAALTRPASTEPERLLTRAEVAELLNVNERTVPALVANQGLPCVRIGRRGDFRFSPSKVREWVQGRGHGSRS